MGALLLENEPPPPPRPRPRLDDLPRPPRPPPLLPAVDERLPLLLSPVLPLIVYYMYFVVFAACFDVGWRVGARSSHIRIVTMMSDLTVKISKLNLPVERSFSNPRALCSDHALTLSCLTLIEDEDLVLLLAKAMMLQQNHTGRRHRLVAS